MQARKTQEGETIYRSGQKMDSMFPVSLRVCRAGPLLGPEVSATLDPRADEEPDQVLKATHRFKEQRK